MSALTIEHLSIRFGEHPAVNDISFALSSGDIACLLGPSGCGKTTLLRSIAGFETPTTGTVSLRGNVVSQPHWRLPTEQRHVGMVFQDFALFPHLNVYNNIGFGLRHLNATATTQRITEVLTLVGLPHAGRQYPHELSGGEQQRVALARAIAPQPSILLLDEPFSSIDIELREQLAQDLRKILKTAGITTLLVTHDQIEAFAVADHIGVINAGRLHQWASAYELYHQPKDPFVADFIGRGTFIRGTVLEHQRLQTSLGILSTQSLTDDFVLNDQVNILIRPDDIIHDDASPQTATIVEKTFQGAQFLYTLALDNGEQVLCFAPSHHNHSINEAIGIRVELDHVVMFKYSSANARPSGNS